MVFFILIGALALRFLAFAFATWIIVMNWNDMAVNGVSFWPVFWILLALFLALTRLGPSNSKA